MTKTSKQKSPSPQEVRALRRAHGKTQLEMAQLLRMSLSGYERYERDPSKAGTRNMPAFKFLVMKSILSGDKI